MPNRIIISHGDMDHAGGLGALQARYPDSNYRANLPNSDSDLTPCLAGQNWKWHAARFDALHPSRGLPYLGNDSSCVISAKARGGSLLLSGDISRAIERRLVAEGLASHDVVLVPHHGSSDSSGKEFISTVQARIAIATTGLGNRFGFPREEVRERYRQSGTEFWSTGACGALKVTIFPQGDIEASSARRHRNRIWRWPAAENCP